MDVQKRLAEIDAEFNQVNGRKQALVNELKQLDVQLIKLQGAHAEVSRNLPKAEKEMPKVAKKAEETK